MTNKKRFSFEYFPPRTAVGREKLPAVTQQLAALNPDFFSVTYGAGGSTRDGTEATVLEIMAAGHKAAPHLSFGHDDDAAVFTLLQKYADAGIDRVVALRGDAPSGIAQGGMRYANELVGFIKDKFADQFHIEVAAYPETHPQATDDAQDLSFFKQKVEAGADSAITQYFYNADAYFDFVDRAQQTGINVPIVPGIMPITNYENLVRFSTNSGAEIPRWILKRLEYYAQDLDALKAFGVEVVSQLCQRLLDGGAPGLHFYCLNQVQPCSTIWQNLGLSERN